MTTEPPEISHLGYGLRPTQVLAIILAVIIGGSLGFYFFITRGDLLLFHNGQLVDKRNADAILAAYADKGNYYTVYTMRGTGWGIAFLLVSMIVPGWLVADLVAWSNRRSRSPSR
jgi:hypothetical protein